MVTRELIVSSPNHGTHTIFYDEADAAKVEPHSWCLVAGHGTLYAKRSLPRRKDGSRPSPLQMHREINGTPKGMSTLHLNGNGLDNRRSNLMSGSRALNMLCRGPTKQNTTGFRGVYECGDSKKNPFTAKIQYNNRVLHLGHYQEKVVAAQVVDMKLVELEPDLFIRAPWWLNFPKRIDEYLAESFIKKL